VAYTRDQFNNFADQQTEAPPPTMPWAHKVGPGLPVGSKNLSSFTTRSGRKAWDWFYSTLRTLEGTIPMGMLQTFHLSEILSPFASPANIELLLEEHPELFQSRGFKEYLSHTTGKSIKELERLGAFKKGLSWKKTGKALGELRVLGGPVIASNIAAVSTGSRRSGFLIEWLGHVMGVKNPAFLKNLEEAGEATRPLWLFAGGGAGAKQEAKLAARLGYAVVSSAVGRMNLLLKSPADLEIVEDWVEKAPLLKGLNLGVKAGPAHKMLWRYTKKGALAFAAYKALDFADYLGRDYGQIATVPGGILGGIAAGAALGMGKGSRVAAGYAAVGGVIGGLFGLGGEGPLSTLAKSYARVRILQAELAESTGLASGARKTEDLFPGLTKPATLVAAAGVGLLLGGTKDWGEKLYLAKAVGRSAKSSKGGAVRARTVFEEVDSAVERRKLALYQEHIKAARQQKGLGKLASELKARYYGGVKKGKFKASTAGRTAAVAVGAYELMNVAGSIAAGDYTGALFQGAALGAATYAYAKKGGALGLGILFLSHLLRGKDDPEELRRIYSGEQEVPIKAGRWWELGRTDYQGRRPYYRPHRVALMRSGGDKAALYGSEANYWKTDPLLNPVGFFMNPYAREELMWEQGYRFPVSRTPFEDAPVLGPLLAATVGKILKPTKFMGRDQWMEEPLERGPDGQYETRRSEPIQRTGIQGTIGEQAYRLTELIGLPGFAIQSMKEAITGTPTFFEKDQWATPSLVSGAEPSWWSLELGGLGLLSESIRRYIPHKRNEIEYINPLPSGLPSWLPGPESGYFLDFSRADIYHKIKEPWYRLPGKGLAALHPELKGVDPEYYNDFWRFKVLADVAPWSREFGMYDRMVTSSISRNRLSADQILEVNTIRKQVRDVKKAKHFQQYRYDSDAVQKRRVRIAEEVEPGVYLTDTFGSAPIRFAGVDLSPISLAGIAESEDSRLSGREAISAGFSKRAQVSDFLREYIYPGAEVDVFVHRDPSGLMERGPSGRPEVPAVVSVGGTNLNRELIRRGLAEQRSDGEALDPTMATGGAQRLFGKFWENLAHNAETPLESVSPLAPVAKFVHQRTALEEYQRSEVYGKEIALWNSPIDNFIAPGLTTTAWWAGWRGLPQKVQQKYMVDEYFDRLELEKWKRLRQAAIAEEDGKSAALYQRQAGMTKAGSNGISEHSIRRALSTNEKSYFKEFVESPTAAERREIANVVSPQMREILQAQWARRAAEAATMHAEAGISSNMDMSAVMEYQALRGAEGRRRRQEEQEAIMQNASVPGPNWLGWDPNSEIEDYKVKTVLDNGLDTVSYGVWRSDVRRVSRRPWVNSIEYPLVDREVISTFGAKMSLNSILAQQGARPMDVFPRGTESSIEIDSPGFDRFERYLRDPSIMQF
jgi:hypothetical protein